MGKERKIMKNREIHGYNDLPACDTHIHILYPKTPDETLEILKALKGHFEYDSISIQTLTRCSGHRECDPSNTLKGLYVREMLNREFGSFAYVYGNVLHHMDGTDTADATRRKAVRHFEKINTHRRHDCTCRQKQKVTNR